MKRIKFTQHNKTDNITAMNMKFRNLQLSADFNIQYNSLEILKLGEV